MASAVSTTTNRVAKESHAELIATYCKRDESWQDQEGFGIRASSTNDSDALSYVLNFPPYGLPIDMVEDERKLNEAPIRFARVKMPDGRIAIVQTVFVQGDSIGRGGNYLSHFIILDASDSRASAPAAIRAWKAPGWRRTYAAGEPKTLAPGDGLPIGDYVSDELLKQYLADDNQRRSRDANGLVPDLKPPPSSVLHRTVCGFRLLHEQTEKGRRRLFVRAKPGTVALLVYGLTRLLPHSIVADITFSTYENTQRGLREFGLAQIVGTCTYENSTQLSQEFFRQLGYAIDTFLDVSSSELTQENGDFDHLIELARQGRWERLDLYQEIWRLNANVTFETLHQGIDLWNVYRKLADRTAKAEDIATLAKLPLGFEALLKHESYVLPRVLRWWPEPDQIPAQFAKWLQHRLPQLEIQAVDSLVAGDEEEWNRPLRLVIEVAHAPERETWFFSFVRKTRERRGCPHSFATRKALLEFWSDYAKRGSLLPAGESGLLLAGSKRELKDLLASSIPELWKGQTISLWVERAEQVDDAKLVLSVREHAEAFCAYLNLAKTRKDGITSLLTPLLTPPDDSETPLRFKQMHDCGLRLTPAAWEELFREIKAATGSWASFWRNETRLRLLDELIHSDSHFREEVWDVLIRFLVKEEYLVVRELPKDVVAWLETVKTFWKSMPEASKRIFRAFQVLRIQLWKPHRESSVTPDELEVACQRLDIDDKAQFLVACFSPSFEHSEKIAFSAIQDAVSGFFRSGEEAALMKIMLDIVEPYNGDKTPFHTHLLKSMPAGSQLDLALAFSDRLCLAKGTEAEMLTLLKTRFRKRFILYGTLLLVLGTTIGFVAAALLFHFSANLGLL